MGQHRGAFEYDWRHRFGVPLQQVGGRMSWGEAWRLTMVLAGDPSSQVGAALGGLSYPVDRADLVLRDLFDLQHQSKSRRRVPPYPRPFPDSSRRTLGAGSGRPIGELRAILDAHRAAADHLEGSVVSG